MPHASTAILTCPAPANGVANSRNTSVFEDPQYSLTRARISLSFGAKGLAGQMAFGLHQRLRIIIPTCDHPADLGQRVGLCPCLLSILAARLAVLTAAPDPLEDGGDAK